MKHAAESGVTSVQTCDLRSGSWPTVLEAFNRVEADHPITRVYHQSSFQNLDEYREFLAAGHVTGQGSPMNRFGPLKLFVDGSLGARTALMRSPYHDDPSTCGIATLTVDELQGLVNEAVDHKCSVIIHAIGDAAIERVLNAYDAVCTEGKTAS